MTLKASLKYAFSLVFPKTEKSSSGQRSLLGASLCIGISLIPLIIVLCVSNGMIDGMTERIIGLSSGHLQAYVASGINETSSAEQFKEYSDYIKTETALKNAFPEVSISALAASNSFRSGIQIRGMDAGIFKNNTSFAELFTVLEGEYQKASDIILEEKKAVIGEKLAQNLNVHKGDTLRIITTRKINGNLSPKMTSFTVSAIVSSGYQELDALWFFIPIESVYKYLPLENASFTIMMEDEDAFSPQLVNLQKRIKKITGRFANVYRWDQLHQSEFESFSSTKILLVFIMLLIVLVATVNISSAIVMLVMERRKEIGILKSIGATSGGISCAFLFTGLSCGLSGIMIGLPLGLLCSVNINQILNSIEKMVNFAAGLFSGDKTSIKLMDPAFYLQTIPVELPFSQIFLIVLLTLLLSLIVSIIPAIKAGKEKPIDILRKN